MRSFFAQWQCGYYFGSGYSPFRSAESSYWQRSMLSATTIYSYIDDRGTPVLTDNIESIPERYRAKVQSDGTGSQRRIRDHSAAVKLQQMITDFWHTAQMGDSVKSICSEYFRTHSLISLKFSALVASSRRSVLFFAMNLRRAKLSVSSLYGVCSCSLCHARLALHLA